LPRNPSSDRPITGTAPSSAARRQRALARGLAVVARPAPSDEARELIELSLSLSLLEGLQAVLELQRTRPKASAER